MREKPEYGLLDALSTRAAKDGLDPRNAGYSPDMLLLKAVQDFFDKRAKGSGSLFLTPPPDARVFIGAMIVDLEEGFYLYMRWRQSAIDKMAAMSTAAGKKAA